VTPQNANHYSLAQVQVNKLQTFSVQQMGISMQQFYSVTQVHCKGQLHCVTKGVYSYKLQFMKHAAISSVILTARVDYSLLIVQGDKIH
jgi:hypothetical protein